MKEQHTDLRKIGMIFSSVCAEFNFCILLTGKPMNDEESMVENGPMKEKKSNEEN